MTDFNRGNKKRIKVTSIAFGGHRIYESIIEASKATGDNFAFIKDRVSGVTPHRTREAWRYEEDKIIYLKDVWWAFMITTHHQIWSDKY